jgi:hypothetical protein
MPDNINPFDSAAAQVVGDQTSAIRQNISQNVGQNADTAAQYQHLAKFVNVPVETVYAEPEAIKQQAAVQKLDAPKMVNEYPHLAQFISEPNNAAKAHDDVQPLAATEQAVKALPVAHPASQPDSDTSGWLSKNIHALPDTPMALMKGFAGSFNDAMKAINLVAGAFPTFYDQAAEEITGQRHTEASDWWFRHSMDPLVANEPAFALDPKATTVEKTLHGIGGLIGTISQIISTGGVGEVAPAAGVTMDAVPAVATTLRAGTEQATKTMALPAVTNAVNSAQQVYDQTGDANAAIKSALSSYATTTATGVLPVSLEGNLLTRALSGLPAGVLTGEANREVTNATNPGTMQTPFNVDDMIVNALTGSILAGAMGHKGRPQYERVMREQYQEGKQAMDAVQAGEGLQALSEVATQSKLRERDPQAFNDYVHNMTADGHTPELYVDAKILSETFKQSGITADKLAEQMPDVVRQMQEALTTGTDVRITTSDYATHIAGGPVDDILRQHLKVDPNGKTIAEAEEYLKGMQKHTEELTSALAESQPVDDARNTQLKAIHDEHFAELETAGRFPSDVNKQYATLRTALIDRLAEREGLDVTDVHKMLPLKVTGEVQTRNKDSLDQKSLAEWDAFLHGLDYSEKEAPKPGKNDESEFLSNVDAGTRHTDESPLLKRIRKSSDAAADELGGSAEAGRVVKKSLGPFSGYRTSADIIEGDSIHPDGRLEVHVYGKEQDAKGGDATSEPALTFTVSKDGELTVNGPTSAAFKEFVKQGWADTAKGKGGELQDGWTALKTKDGKPLSLTELAPLIADVHARVRTWRGEDKVGLHWSRSTGATGDISEGRKTAVFFQEMLQGERGFFNTKTNTMGLLKDADLSTYLHETGHYWLESMNNFVQRTEATPGLKKDFDELLNWFKVEGDSPEARLENWNKRTTNEKRESHEKFAEGFERYLMEGKAPTAELQSLFSRFRAWLVRVYEGVQAPGEIFSPEIKAVFDRMLASDHAIAEAERNRAYFPADFKDANPELLAHYTELGRKATDDAVSDMQARTLRDMKWLNNAQSKAMKALQREAKGLRTAIREEVTKQVMAEPVNQGAEAIKAAGFKTNSTGLEVDLIAEQYGFANGKALTEAIRNENVKEKINGMVEQSMLERHGEFVDATSLQRAAEAAIANEARAKQMATGLKILTKSPVPVSKIQKAAKEAAETTIASKVIKDLRPAIYSAAESRANKELLKLAPKDPAAAAQAQRAALLNNRLFKASTEAVQDVKSGLTYLKKFGKDTIRAKIDVDIRDQIDDLLARFDLRANPNTDPTRQQVNLEKWIESQMAAGWQPSVTEAMLDTRNRKPYRDMSVEEFRGLIDTIKSMEHLGRERETLTVNGEKFALADYVNNELVPRMKERGDNFTTEEIYSRPEDRGISEWRQGLDKFNSWMRAFNAQLMGQEFKRNAYDRHEIMGPFGQALFEPVMQANYRKVDMLKGLSDDFRAKVVELGRDWQKGLTEMIDNKTLLDDIASKESGEPVPFKLSRGKMIGLAVHVGNESNFDKLTKGYKWNPVDVWKFLDENMTAKDWNAVQTIWDLYEKHWPEQVAMYRRLGQTAPDKIEPRPFKTRFGDMRGGYATIKYDALRSRRGEKDAQGMAINPNDGLFGRDYFSRNSTTNGAMKSRNDSYTDAIDLNFHTIERAMHESIHDLAYREALINANKVIEQSDFRKQFLKTYGREDYRALQDWIGRIANAENTDRNVGAFGRFLQYTRTGLVMTAIALRISTVAKHGGSAGIKTMGYFVGGGEKFLASRMASMTHDYRSQIQGAIEKFPEIRARLLQQDRDYRATASSLFESESLQSRAERFGHSAVAWADMVTAVPTAWAAYDRAITVGIPKNQGGTGKPMTEAQAVEYGSKTVREAHGSNIESARSNIMTAPSEAVKMFTILYGFMNNSYGQMADSVSKIRTPGMGNPVVLARTFMAIIVPAFWAHYLTHGTADDSDESLAMWIAKAVLGEVAGSLPMVREAAQMANGFNKAGVVGAESWVSTMVNAAKDVVKIAKGDEPNRPIADIADAVGMGLHIPGLGQLGKTAQYIADVNAGKIHPHSTWEFIHDAALGHKEHK